MLDDTLFDPVDRTENGDFTESNLRRVLNADREFRLWQQGCASTQSTASVEWGAFLQARWDRRREATGRRAVHRARRQAHRGRGVGQYLAGVGRRDGAAPGVGVVSHP